MYGRGRPWCGTIGASAAIAARISGVQGGVPQKRHTELEDQAVRVKKNATDICVVLISLRPRCRCAGHGRRDLHQHDGRPVSGCLLLGIRDQADAAGRKGKLR
ncbi:protein of unknown function [Paraburkholderia kururiensis]